MLINSSTTVHIHTHSPTSNLTLTPYLPVHVRRYHAWMQDPDIRELTASDPLTLEEEYAMQRSWRSDYDKLTFIVYNHGSGGYEIRNGIDRQNRQLSEEGMVGDVNLFLFLDDDDNDDDDSDEHAADDTNNVNINGNHNDENHDNHKKIVIGELELMLAEPSARGRGLGSAVLLALLMYVAKHEREIVAGFLRDRYEGEGEGEGSNNHSCRERGSDDGEGKGEKINKIEHFRVRIANDNIRSLKLFEGLGFKRTSTEPNYFGEVEMRRYPSAAKGWEEDVQEMMREKGLDGWEEKQMHLVE